MQWIFNAVLKVWEDQSEVRARALAKGLVLTGKIHTIHVSAEEAFSVATRLNVVYMTVGIVTAC